MARMMNARRPMREGTGMGTHVAEYTVFILIGIGLLLAARWYFFVYLRSPQYALKNFISALSAGHPDQEWDMLTASSRAGWRDKSEFSERWPLAQGYAARVANYTIENLAETPEKAEADVTLTVRKGGQELYQSGTDSFKDHWVLVKEGDGWKVDLTKSKLKSAGGVPDRR